MLGKDFLLLSAYVCSTDLVHMVGGSEDPELFVLTEPRWPTFLGGGTWASAARVSSMTEVEIYVAQQQQRWLLPLSPSAA